MVFTDCESCTRPISTNLGSMEAGEGWRKRGTRFIARRREVVAVAGLLWISWCLLSAAGFFVFFFFERTRPTASMRPPCLVYLSTSTGVRTGCPYLISLSVCLCLCVLSVTFVVVADCESGMRPISTNPASMEAGECGLTRGTCFATRRLELVVVAGRLWISWRDFSGVGFLRFFFSSNAHGLLQVRGHTLPLVPLY